MKKILTGCVKQKPVPTWRKFNLMLEMISLEIYL